MAYTSYPHRTLRFEALESPLAVELQWTLMAELLSSARRELPQETGGILLGRYSMDMRTAIVTQASGPPPDSRATPTTFLRGTTGLQEKLDVAWEQSGDYYLGEWHTHPHADPMPSSLDDRQLRQISQGSYNCPEPLLLILGRELVGVGDCALYLYYDSKSRLTLKLKQA